jgi:flagellar basal-body rod protein FlgB
MADGGLNLFDLVDRRLQWLDRRQAVLAQNIANANTPGYVSKDLAPFTAALAQAAPVLATTNPAHLSGADDAQAGTKAVRPEERAPDGNAVSIDQELTKVADTDGQQALVTNLYHKYLGLYRTAIGK